MHADVGGNARQQIRVRGLPTVPAGRRPGYDERLITERREMPDGTEGAVHTCAPDRRKLARQHENSAHRGDANEPDPQPCPKV
jgi:hypothetical protein